MGLPDVGARSAREHSRAPEGEDPLSYRLIEEHRYSSSELSDKAGPVAGLFRMEQRADPGELIQIAEQTARGLPGTAYLALREALGTWVASSALPRLTRDFEIPRKIDLTEVPSMLEQRVAE